MKDVIQIDIGTHLLKRERYFVRIKPHWCKYPVIGLPWEIIPMHTCTISRQSRSLVGTHLQLLEFEAHEKTKVNFIVSNPSGFLFFLLSGEVSFHDWYGAPVSHAQGSVYYLAYNSAGKFSISVVKGNHHILAIALDNDWFFPSVEDNYPAFKPFLELLSSNGDVPIILPQIKITLEIANILSKIRSAVVSYIDESLNVLKFIAECLTIYHRQLQEGGYSDDGDQLKGQRLVEHLSNVYMLDDECRLDRILETMGWTRWTLRNVEKNVLGCTVGEYVRKLRIEKAVELLLTTELKLHEISIEVGFSSADSLAKAFKKLKGISPTDFRHFNP